MTILLALLYPLAIQIERGGWWLLVTPITLLALAIDVIANYTELALLTWDWPQKGEYTFSTRLLRLQHDMGWRGDIALRIKPFLNYFDPQGDHV